MTKEEGLYFYSMTIAYNFDVEVERYEFCEGCDLLWVFGCLGFWFGKVINVFYFITKGKKKKNLLIDNLWSLLFFFF